MFAAIHCGWFLHLSFNVLSTGAQIQATCIFRVSNKLPGLLLKCKKVRNNFPILANHMLGITKVKESKEKFLQEPFLFTKRVCLI